MSHTPRVITRWVGRPGRSRQAATVQRIRRLYLVLAAVTLLLMLPPVVAAASSAPARLAVALASAAGVLAGAVSGEALVAVRSMLNPLTLALRSTRANQELSTQARTDSLTGLANRASFTKYLHKQLADGADRLALLFIDLDNVKDVNDVLGHGAGDSLLRGVAVRLRQVTRPGDMCARLGGDEFAVVLPGAADETAVAVAGRILTAVATPVAVGSRSARVGASVGVSYARQAAAGTSSCSRPMSRCTPQRPTARTASGCSGRACCTWTPTPPWSGSWPRPLRAASSWSATSPSCRCRSCAVPPRRRWCAGGTRPGGCCRRRSSSSPPSAAARSPRSGRSCSRGRARMPSAGPPTRRSPCTSTSPRCSSTTSTSSTSSTAA